MNKTAAALRPVLPALAMLMMLGAGTATQAQFRLVSESQELQAGRQADAQIRKEYRVSNNRQAVALIETMGNRITRVSERPNIDWTYRVIESSDLNAFSVPGYVYVNTGLINVLRNDRAALAGVVAHEVAHTTGRHAANRMEKSALAGFLGSLLGRRSSTVAGLVNVATNLVMLGYSRDDENDADRRAVRYMVAAGYDPNGLVRFFRMLQERGDRGGGGLTSYFRTHPPTGNRIERVQEMIAQTDAPVSRAHRSYLNDETPEERRRRLREEERERERRRFPW